MHNLIVPITKKLINTQFIPRFGYIGVGLLGCSTLLPNIMMCGSGTNKSLLYAAYIGSFSSFSFMLSGISGVLYGRFIPIIISNTFFGIGFIFQLCAFALLK